MAATFGTLVLKGVSGKTYSIDLAIPDAIATKVTFNASGLAGTTSNAYHTLPESAHIVDIIAVGAPTAVGAIFTIDGANLNGQCVRWNNQLASLPNRAQLRIPVHAGVQLGLTQF